jgi:hypothetical protein
MDKMKNVPEIRFKGYEGEWNEHHFVSISVSLMRRMLPVYIINMTSILFRENMV